MLEAYTINAAYALRFEDCTGSLEPGKDASFTRLDRNPLLYPVEQLTQMRIVETCFRGEVVHAAPDRSNGTASNTPTAVANG
ncbi:amidohydrolase family protein [Paraburkholderia sp. B3]|uniref:amidohydrolase family protein n=1 Tax=Paraburkholderia sp. B3 TaxID=3134791 RepID=UPI0039823587